MKTEKEIREIIRLMETNEHCPRKSDNILGFIVEIKSEVAKVLKWVLE